MHCYLASWLSTEQLRGEGILGHPGLMNGTRAWHSGLSVRFVLEIFPGQFILPLASYKSWKVESRSENPGTTKPYFFHDHVAQKIPTIWLTCAARKDVLYPGSEPLLPGCVSHQQNTAWMCWEFYSRDWTEENFVWYLLGNKRVRPYRDQPTSRWLDVTLPGLLFYTSRIKSVTILREQGGVSLQRLWIHCSLKKKFLLWKFTEIVKSRKNSYNEYAHHLALTPLNNRNKYVYS